jgi:hypothetical protein
MPPKSGWCSKFNFYLVPQVDLKKVNLNVIRPWIAKKVTELVGLEDEVVVEYAMGLLDDPNHTVCLFTRSRLFRVYCIFLLDSGPKENANKSDRFPHGIDAFVYDCSLVSTAGGSGASRRRAPDVRGGEERRNAQSPRG